jgi:hypothetical protein
MEQKNPLPGLYFHYHRYHRLAGAGTGTVLVYPLSLTEVTKLEILKSVRRLE